MTDAPHWLTGPGILPCGGLARDFLPHTRLPAWESRFRPARPMHPPSWLLPLQRFSKANKAGRGFA